MARSQFLDISGQRFGRLIAVRRVTGPGEITKWECVCDCGATTITRVAKLRFGAVKSCGCLQRDMARARMPAVSRKDGRSGHPLYKTWMHMMERCTNPNDKRYADYGGRGITVCDRWQDPANFYADMGERPTGTSIDRIDNNLGYEPGNCRWATPKTQNNNRRSTRLATLNGETLSLAEWSRRLGAGSKDLVRERLRAGWEITAALTTPVGPQRIRYK